MFNARCAYLACLDAKGQPDAILILDRGDGWMTVEDVPFHLNGEKLHAFYDAALAAAANGDFGA